MVTANDISRLMHTWRFVKIWEHWDIDRQNALSEAIGVRRRKWRIK